MRVLVTDGDQRAALAITRSLGKRGIGVLVGQEYKRSLASSSKYCAGCIVYPSPDQNPKGFCGWLLDFLQQNDIGAVLPTTDVTTYLLSLHKRDFEAYTRLPIAEFQSFDFVSDKSALVQHAREIGIPTPRTHFIGNPECLATILDELDYPVVVKASRSRVLTNGRWLSTRVHYASSPAELVQLYEEKSYLKHASLIQERIIGPGLGVFLLFDRGELRVAFSHIRLREKPPSGGVSVLRESAPVDPRLREYAVRLFKPLGWHGVVMMEYKLDQRCGEPLLIEVNGRFWGSLQLAIDAGVDFPYLLYRMAIDGCIEAPHSYQVGLKSRWLLGDLDHLLLRLLKKDLDLLLPPGFPSRARTLLQFLAFCEPHLRYEILSVRDPRPFLYELSQYLQGLVRKGRAARV